MYHVIHKRATSRALRVFFGGGDGNLLTQPAPRPEHGVMRHVDPEERHVAFTTGTSDPADCPESDYEIPLDAFTIMMREMRSRGHIPGTPCSGKVVANTGLRHTGYPGFDL
jgi:hypothetical protein